MLLMLVIALPILVFFFLRYSYGAGGWMLLRAFLVISLLSWTVIWGDPGDFVHRSIPFSCPQGKLDWAGRGIVPGFIIYGE